MLSLIDRASNFSKRKAILSDGQDFTYADLLSASARVAARLLNGRSDLSEARIAFLVEPGYSYVSLQWGIWRAGGIAVPLCVKHPLSSIEYVIDDTSAETVIYGPAFASLLSPLMSRPGVNFLTVEDANAEEIALPDISTDRGAMILYTSGTTGKPKGVVSTHANIEHQITALVGAWEWDAQDHILNVLPLHHVHGIVNVLSCALWSGGCCEFLPRFSPDGVFATFLKGEVNVFMAVPTIYFKLIAHWESLPPTERSKVSECLAQFRLMVSGSAALPVSVLEQWRNISGHTLLERYGMTEMGMAISNPYDGQRQPGHIGLPLPGVTVRLVDEENGLVDEGQSGEIQVKGPNIFREYWGKPAETEATFTSDGWFKTGDMAVFEAGSYRILGRNSVDIIKSGGYKISALEIEEVLRTHPNIKECGVVGIPDLEWGEIIGASLILADGPMELDHLKEWLQTRLPSYKFPRKFIFQDDLPRNVMGKVTKNELKKLFK